ncbi:hypothetical protein [Modestobacter sp. SYSU DS0875]
MPLLGPDDPLPRRPSRVLVAGTSGAGKTTLAARISSVLDLPQVEMDALFHGPDWVPRTCFEDDVRRFAAEPAWVTEWQYRPVRPLLADRADLLVWLDLPRALVMRQVAGRTLRRRMRRSRLWNGNVEPPLHTVLTDPEHVVRVAWRTHHRSPEKVRTLQTDRPDLVVVRLIDRPQVLRWVTGPLTATREPGPG